MHAKLNKDAQHNSTSHVKSLTAVALTYDEHAEFWLSLCSNADMEVHVRMWIRVNVAYSASFLAELSVSSPQKLFIFII